MHENRGGCAIGNKLQRRDKRVLSFSIFHKCNCNQIQSLDENVAISTIRLLDRNLPHLAIFQRNENQNVQLTKITIANDEFHKRVLRIAKKRLQ